MRGQVVLLSSTVVQVAISSQIVSATIKGKRIKDDSIRNTSTPWDKKKVSIDNSLCVGDEVEIENEQGSYKITKKYDRRTSFSRYNFIKDKMQTIASNFDIVCLIISHSTPELNSFFANTILSGLSGNSEVIYIFTKSDIPFTSQDRDIIEEIKGAKFNVLELSSKNNSNIEVLKDIIKNKTALFVGESGSGKSTLLNKIFSKDLQIVGDLSKKNKMGCHTTTSSVLLSDESFSIIDTPGVRFVRPLTMEYEKLSRCFPEIFSLQCKYSNCKHIGEDGCTIEEAIQSGKIGKIRYEDYRQMLLKWDDRK